MDATQVKYHELEVSNVLETITAMHNPFDVDVFVYLNFTSNLKNNQCLRPFHMSLVTKMSHLPMILPAISKYDKNCL